MRSPFGDTVFTKVVQAIEQTLHIAGYTLAPATRLVDDLQLGRFGRIKLILYLEETFDTEIPDHAAECFDTIEDIANYMRRWSFETAQMVA